MMMFKKAYNLRIISLILAMLFLYVNPAYSLRVPLDSKRLGKFINSSFPQLPSWQPKLASMHRVNPLRVNIPWEDYNFEQSLPDFIRVKLIFRRLEKQGINFFELKDRVTLIGRIIDDSLLEAKLKRAVNLDSAKRFRKGKEAIFCECNILLNEQQKEILRFSLDIGEQDFSAYEIFEVDRENEYLIKEALKEDLDNRFKGDSKPLEALEEMDELRKVREGKIRLIVAINLEDSRIIGYAFYSSEHLGKLQDKEDAILLERVFTTEEYRRRRKGIPMMLIKSLQEKDKFNWIRTVVIPDHFARSKGIFVFLKKLLKELNFDPLEGYTWIWVRPGNKEYSAIKKLASNNNNPDKGSGKKTSTLFNARLIVPSCI
ncbi:MAG: hypothetical protein KJ706_05610 [Candidatus Omnitrophica bacterium]|nr:hypothetical protein [Candidatus Omnitrophota bacterium]